MILRMTSEVETPSVRWVSLNLPIFFTCTPPTAAAAQTLTKPLSLISAALCSPEKITTSAPAPIRTIPLSLQPAHNCGCSRKTRPFSQKVRAVCEHKHTVGWYASTSLLDLGEQRCCYWTRDFIRSSASQIGAEGDQAKRPLMPSSREKCKNMEGSHVLICV